MTKYPFNPEKETSIIGIYPGKPEVPIYDTPITPKENFRMALEGQDPLWIPTGQDWLAIDLACLPDNMARGGRFGHAPLKDEEKGGPDMFGVMWEYVPVTGGSMVRPGNPMLKDVTEWKSVIKFPNPDEWKWEEGYKEIEDLTDDRRLRKSTIPSGLFERLISFMEFENALMAIYDEDTKPAVHELFSALCDVYEKIIDNMVKYLHIDLLEFHDDWGSQRAPFFSPALIEEMIVPYLRRICDYAHSKGLFVNFHSCGKNETLVPCMLDAHVDFWIPQQINDFDLLLEQYKGQIMIGIDPPVIPAGTSDEEVQKIAHEYVMKHIDNPRTFVFKSPSRHVGNPSYELFFNQVYLESRKLLAEKNA